MLVGSDCLEETIKRLGWHVASLKKAATERLQRPNTATWRSSDPNQYLISQLREIFRSQFVSLHDTRLVNGSLEAAIVALETPRRPVNIGSRWVSEREATPNVESVRQLMLRRLTNNTCS